MRTHDKVLAFCSSPRTAQEIADYCKVQRSSIYSALGRLQMKGLVARLGDGTERATYVSSTPSIVVHEENLMIKHAHNPFGLTA
jgi:sugar-specific transcriptional regulator TrmB